MDEKSVLEERKAKYARLKAVIDAPGWSEVSSILEDSYHEALGAMKKSVTSEELWKSRGVIEFIDTFMSQIQSDIDFGKTAQERYVKKFINSQEG